MIVKPATVIAWHQRLCRGYRQRRSGKLGRPPIPLEHIALIGRISREHPEGVFYDWGGKPPRYVHYGVERGNLKAIEIEDAAPYKPKIWR